ncbi:GTP-binding protein ypt3 [Nannizzia gypsea CBS 118893]|uniref:GTP-binding protein ypt3 n=1 Tax=Arthroderma gypseum (strain ATCC MYA-4604 / CBS 118893) TaxID=535722 RepID=E4V5Q6_ARTGP|nr:GTP-binding protein ypt3 [Nannizzia gypsea CBS 118893]EFR05431.1 GTP-binding protein ypt3 [Nannizzia gypsea CBS 118893]
MSNSLEAKIVVLGAQGVGKTSLVQRYVRNSFSKTAPASTVGASFVTKRVLDSTSDTIVRLQIWDTAGQERFRSISRLYYRGAHAGLLCYDITDERSFDEMRGWLLELKQNLGPNASAAGGAAEDTDGLVIHVVGTKSDIVADDPARRRVPFERTIAYVAEQLYPSQASTPPPSSGIGSAGSNTNNNNNYYSGSMAPDSKRNSGFWAQDIGWDCCHEISSKDGEGIDEVFRVITRKLVEQRSRRERHGDASSGSGVGGTSGGASGAGAGAGAGGLAGSSSIHSPGSNGSIRARSRAGRTSGDADKRRSWLSFPPALVGDADDDYEHHDDSGLDLAIQRKRCC